MEECEVVGRELIVAGCHTPTVLDLVEEPFDQISGPVKIRTEAQFLCPISLRWDICPGAVVAGDTGPVLVYADDGRVDHLYRRIVVGAQCIHDPVPHASPAPTDEAIVASRARPKTHRQITPWRT